MLQSRALRGALVAAIALCVAVPGIAQDKQRGAAQEAVEDTLAPLPTADAAAAQGLEILRAVVATQDAGELGFASREDVARAALGPPMPVFVVGLDALRAYAAGADAKRIVEPVKSVVYPVLVDGEVRSSITVEGQDSGWSMASVGNSALVMAVAKVRRSISAEKVAMVRVLALNLVFLGEESATGWRLTPILDDTSVKLRAGVSETAADVFARLAPIARAHNGLPT